MGNKWTTSPTSPEIIIDEDEPPPESFNVEGVLVTLLELKDFSFSQLESKNGGKLRTLLRVSSSYNNQVSYAKPIHKVKSKEGLAEWHLHKSKFFFPTSAHSGEVKVALIDSCLPLLPAVPHDNNGTPSLEKKKAVTLASFAIHVSVDECKTQNHIERWIIVESQNGEQSQVKVALDYMSPQTFSINDKYEIDNVLGAGQSVVKKGINKQTKKEYAVKFIAKQTPKGQDIPRGCTDQEIELMSSLSHQNIVELYEALESDDTRYIVMELVKGDDLHDVSSTLGPIRPGVAGAIIGQLLSAVTYLHSLGIVHHDIKMENVIVDYHANMVKLTDFGSAKEIKHMSGVGGTINYMAPELLLNMRGSNQKCDQSIDIWSVGIVAYMLLSGSHPFDHPTKGNNNIINCIISGKFDFSSPLWDAVPKHCKDFIQRCLVVEPKRRPSAADLLKHPWITSSCAPTPANMFSNQDKERLDQENAKSTSPSNSMTSLLELFGNCPSRS